MKPPELNPETEESLPSRRSPEGPDPPLLTEVSLPSDSPLDLESVEKKMNSGHYSSVVRGSKRVWVVSHNSIIGNLQEFVMMGRAAKNQTLLFCL